MFDIVYDGAHTYGVEVGFLRFGQLRTLLIFHVVPPPSIPDHRASARAGDPDAIRRPINYG